MAESEGQVGGYYEGSFEIVAYMVTTPQGDGSMEVEAVHDLDLGVSGLVESMAAVTEVLVGTVVVVVVAVVAVWAFGTVDVWYPLTELVVASRVLELETV